MAAPVAGLAVDRPRRSSPLRNVNAGRLVLFGVVLLISLITMVPFFVLLSYTFRPMETVMNLPIEWLPSRLSVDGILLVLDRPQFLRWFFNSALVTIINTSLMIFTSSLAGYTFARKSFPGKDLIFWACMAMIVVPFQITMIPLFVTFARLGLVNSYGGLILICVASIYGTFLFRQYILGIPRDYDDAAKVDGASEFQIYSLVILPQCGPVVAVLGAFTFIGQWNSYLWPMLIINSEELMTLPVGLALMQSMPTAGDPALSQGVMLAAATLMIIPTITTLFVMQKYIIQGVALSGVKG